MRAFLLSSLLAAGLSVVLADPIITTYKNVLKLSSPFNPLKDAYWTEEIHHRRSVLGTSPNGKFGFFAYLDSTLHKVYVQQIDVETFEAVGAPFSVDGSEAGGLVVHDDGAFALLTNIPPSGSPTPPNHYPIAALIKVKDGAELWRTPLNGPTVRSPMGHSATPDLNGDVVWSEKSQMYGAYFVVTGYDGDTNGHFGDSIQYVDKDGVRKELPETSYWGCSHSVGNAIETADAPPFCTVCAEDQGASWLNTIGGGMSTAGTKIFNENTTQGSAGEPLNGMNQGFSLLSLFPGTTKYVLSYLSRGCINLHGNDWMNNIEGKQSYTQCDPRFLNHNVAIALMSDKKTLVGPPATSEIGAKDGDKQVHWITYSKDEDHQNVHSAALDSNLALLTYERITNPACQPLPMGCLGTFSGTVFQFVNSDGKLVGSSVTREDVTVAGDIALFGDKLCWPYIADHAWDVSKTLSDSGLSYTVDAISIACASNSGKSSDVTTPVPGNGTSSVDADPVNADKDPDLTLSPVSEPSQNNGTHKMHKKHKHRKGSKGNGGLTSIDTAVDQSTDKAPREVKDPQTLDHTNSHIDHVNHVGHVDHVNHVNHINHINHINSLAHDAHEEKELDCEEDESGTSDPAKHDDHN